jgi:hypothetical protein
MYSESNLDILGKIQQIIPVKNEDVIDEWA